jgi:hypothetical protein
MTKGNITMSDLIRLCGLWKGESSKGNRTVSGTLGNARLWLFPNTKKQSDKSPDYWLCLGPKDSNATGQSDRPGRPDDEDIPF